MEEINIDRIGFNGDKAGLILPDGYEFEAEGNDVFVIKKKPKYPTTYKECCEVLMGKTNFQDFELVLTKLSINRYEENSISPEPPYINLINNFYKLLICRDAYWKIVCEQMGLNGSWKPDWKDREQIKFVIIAQKENIQRYEYMLEHKILAFPNKEMRDAFYENFKDLIEQCKELL